MVSAAAPLSPQLREQRERVFLILAGIFIGAMAMLNIVGVIFGAAYWRGPIRLEDLLVYRGSNYLFKFCAALADTVPPCVAVRYLARCPRVDPAREHAG